ncbi:MAG: hypothetical protein JWQ21_641 [Herminiimonas sp.]|nr:hypothetical protein [Herminiimonas sp.]
MTNPLKPIPVEFLASLLELMIFPSPPEPKKNAPKSLRVKNFFMQLVANGNDVRAQPGIEIITNTSGFGSELNKKIFDEIVEPKFRGLQIGAMLYGLYWMSRYPDDRDYATKKFAAKMVAPPTFKNILRSEKILDHVDEFASVAHYWAAFLLVVRPSNYSGLTEEGYVLEEGTQDSLWDFVETVDMSTFLSNANGFLTFLSKYTHPLTKTRQAFSRIETYHWLPPPRSIEQITETNIIPNIWSADYPFASLKKTADEQRAKKLKIGKENYDKIYSSNKKIVKRSK